jgi:hypothetical protein
MKVINGGIQAAGNTARSLPGVALHLFTAKKK